MELLERYIHEVGRHLPNKMRADVETELYSLLMDAVEARLPEVPVEVPAKNGGIPEDVQVEVLEEFGPPAEVAAQYQPLPHYLVGPQLFEAYCITATVMIVLNVLLFSLVGLASIWQETRPLLLLLEMFSNFVSSAATSIGFVTLVFAILERTLPLSDMDDESETSWDPRTLPDVQNEDRIKRVGLLVEIGLIALVVTLFNVFPDRIGIGFVQTASGEMQVRAIPILAPNFASDYLLWLNILWIGSIVLKIILVRQGYWQRGTRIFDFALTVMSVLLLGKMIGGPPLLNFDMANTSELNVVRLIPLFSLLLDVGLIIALLASIWDAIHKLYLLFKKRLVIPLPVFSSDANK